MAKKRTKAQRRAAALEAWRLRKLRMAEKPTPVSKSSDMLPKLEITEYRPVDGPLSPARQVFYDPPAHREVTTIGATKEGREYFVTITHNGSLFRHRVDASALRKLGLDCLTLVG